MAAAPAVLKGGDCKSCKARTGRSVLLSLPRSRNASGSHPQSSHAIKVRMLPCIRRPLLSTGTIFRSRAPGGNEVGCYRMDLAGWLAGLGWLAGWAGLTEVSKGRAGIFRALRPRPGGLWVGWFLLSARRVLAPGSRDAPRRRGGASPRNLHPAARQQQTAH